ncbi:dUTPase [compost metagenome]
MKEKGLQGRDLLPEKILALQVELGECANEWRGFKFWSEDQESRTMQYRKVLKIFPSGDEYISRQQYNPLLEEYIDCLHFILSIGIAIGYEPLTLREYRSTADITYMFTLLPFYAYILLDLIDQDIEIDLVEPAYDDLLAGFLFLGAKLGFTSEQIEEAYMSKNAVNHTRQSTGY